MSSQFLQAKYRCRLRCFSGLARDLDGGLGFHQDSKKKGIICLENSKVFKYTWNGHGVNDSMKTRLIVGSRGKKAPSKHDWGSIHEKPEPIAWHLLSTKLPFAIDVYHGEISIVFPLHPRGR